MKRLSRFLGLFMLVTRLLATEQAAACSSCGSGGADPVVLNPYENRKLYLGLSHQSGFADIDHAGHKRRGYGPEQKQNLDLALAQRLLPRLFVSADLNFGRNVYGSQSVMQNGDISANARLTLLQQNIAEPLVPQIQLLLGHRWAVARSVYDQRMEHGLDVFGAGYDETVLGTDLWWGMSQVMFGGSAIFAWPQAADTETGTIKPGPAQRVIGTVGTLLTDELKLIGGGLHEQRGGFSLDGVDQPNSDRLSHDLFLTAETLYAEGANYRLTFNRRAAFGSNRNASSSQTITLAWMEAL